MSLAPQSSALYEPPAGVSPALARLLLEGAYDDRVFAAALASLAAKNRIHLEETSGGWQMRDGGQAAALSRGERVLAQALFRGKQPCALDRRHYLRFMHARERHYDVVMTEAKPGFLRGAVRWFAGLANPGMPRRDVDRLDALARYRTYLEVAVKDRADPRFAASGTFTEMPAEMPFLIAFGLENSWGDRFVAAVSETVDGYAKSTSLNSLYAENRRTLPTRARRRRTGRGYGNGRHGQEPWDTFEGPEGKW